ncbi:metallophosphoesterase [Pseudomonas syringae]|uniref:Metallophosphoesterase n=2 Tax=Pseudomonas syringae TaxID=317 RepID=A0A3M4K674_PSESF|nr:metallophosphoesterase [Pseudomonas syringae]EPM49070.1 metallophosphoesterase [Pseudomonas syringae pv. actinidiae ICMP 19098]EPN06944.1 metallophosphoesterase [Pseudomonas syringae pv. actinidiae ICMP 18804]EPN19730.1 metallophosphoesterase [Pseudomonas syringae pv. actinidiae ICMP 19100]EPN27596.1 metallophosphoesterase [Pseudomonas syringae pv. actinidiae ICMP 19099]EPN35535.1 metallophosphoesterase [Pseudomonas syringae pv. actinidiae ICMP 18883]
MRVRIYSDLHREFDGWEAPDSTGVDLVLLGGDIDKKVRGVSWANSAFKCPVAYVSGNHEFYDGHVDRTLQKMRDAASGHVHILENETLTLGNLRILGTTGWTDFTSTGDQVAATNMAREWMSDFKYIRTDSNYRRLRPDDVIAKNHVAKAWLREELAKKIEGKTLVLTHHSPSPMVIGNEHEGHLTASYANDWNELIAQANVWIFGHTHYAVDVELAGCRVISNPKGYPNENTGFDPYFEIQI